MLIGINGFKGVGKDTAADYLVQSYDFTKLSFARKLKESVAALFDISLEEVDEFKSEDEEGADYGVTLWCSGSKPQATLTWRQFLQRYGDESHRRIFGYDFWVNQLLRGTILLGNYVISDCRYENEARAICELGGYVIRIERPGVEGDGHASEVPLPEQWIDVTLQNDGTIELLNDRVDEAITWLVERENFNAELL